VFPMLLQETQHFVARRAAKGASADPIYPFTSRLTVADSLVRDAAVQLMFSKSGSEPAEPEFERELTWEPNPRSSSCRFPGVWFTFAQDQD